MNVSYTPKTYTATEENEWSRFSFIRLVLASILSLAGTIADFFSDNIIRKVVKYAVSPIGFFGMLGLACSFEAGRISLSATILGFLLLSVVEILLLLPSRKKDSH